MTREITIGAAIANCGGKTSSQELLQYVKQHTEGVDFYKLRRIPGESVCSAIDWYAILSVSASVITVGQVLWAAYMKFIVPHRESGKDKAFLFITVKNEENEYEQYELGTMDQSEEEFIQKFEERVEEIRNSTADDSAEEELHQFRNSDDWEEQ